MMQKITAMISGCLIGGVLSLPTVAAGLPSWNRQAAAAALDERQAWWASWPSAQRDRGTFCVSCHTALPYALARPVLRGSLGERQLSSAEAALVENVLKRVRQWNEVAPFYPDQTRGIPKTSESRGTESVLNATILVAQDAAKGTLSADTRTALGNMWALQMRTGPNSGAWTWLNFQNEPWESNNSPYLGASLAALAIGSAPERYAESVEIRENMTRLRAYFQHQYEHESVLNRLMALWASAKVSGLLTPEQRTAVIDATFAKQQSDGGWSTASLGAYKRIDNTAIDPRSDGYATGLATLALQEAGVPGRESHVARGLDWLRQHQDSRTGRWLASSLNKERDPESDVGKFMSDAATAYAVMALTVGR